MSNTYKYKENGEVKEMENDQRWNWGVLYEDGAELYQYGNDGWFHSITEVEQDRLDLFTMFQPNGDGLHTIQVTDDMQIFHFYRHVHASHFKNMSDTAQVYVFGFKKDGVATYNFILPDDRVVTSDHDNIDLTDFALTDPANY